MTSKRILEESIKNHRFPLFLMFTIFVKTLPPHNIFLLFCSSKTEGNLNNIEKAVLNFSPGGN